MLAVVAVSDRRSLMTTRVLGCDLQSQTIWLLIKPKLSTISANLNTPCCGKHYSQNGSSEYSPFTSTTLMPSKSTQIVSTGRTCAMSKPIKAEMLKSDEWFMMPASLSHYQPQLCPFNQYNGVNSELDNRWVELGLCTTLQGLDFSPYNNS